MLLSMLLLSTTAVYNLRNVALAGLAVLVWFLCIRPLFNPLRRLAGPPVRRFFGNHLAHVSSARVACKVYEIFQKRHGRSIRIRGSFPWEERVLTMDPTSMAHILRRADIYQKPALSRRHIAGLIGTGMLSAEGQVYHRQKRVILPAFSNHNLRGIVPVVLKKGLQLTAKWVDMLKDKPERVELEMASWINRVTFDIIGLTGFDYDFNAVEDESNELLRAYMEMFDKCAATRGGLIPLLSLYSPVAKWLFPDRVAMRCKSTIHRIAGHLIQEKKHKIALDEKNGYLQSENDLLSLMIKSNSDPSLPPEAKISDQDLLDNVNTLMFAGSDTSSLAVTWTLHLLANHHNVQTRLREEILAACPPDVSLDSLSATEVEALYTTVSSLPFLNNVMRESLRVIPPIHSTLRVAMETDEVPTSSPVHLNGGGVDEKRSFTIPKGTFVHVCVEAFNLDKEVWGDDAWEFNPDRWDCLPERVATQPGVYSHLMSFSGGPRACPGMRFSVTEMKILLFVLLTNFVFDAPEGVEIVKVNKVLTRPHVAGKEGDGAQCPLLVSRYVR